ncbi:MAG: hypothetical protein D6814_07785 [Calditrichaeota bacterium]|nr:MAG: hypothetical protein D6814_07785 [Calditrichota bacterium]
MAFVQILFLFIDSFFQLLYTQSVSKLRKELNKMLYFLDRIINYISRNPARALVFSFLFVIFLGTTALTFPVAGRKAPVPFLTALFTATSATCVTGLTVVDISQVYSHFGQWVILGLIQVGGLGMITFSTFFISIIAGNIGLHSREIIQESFSQQPTGNILHLLYIILGVTFTIEGIGAAVLFIFYHQHLNFAISTSLYHAIFHSISAFCNAGFSLYSDSLIHFQGNWYYSLTIATLIVLGGIGFVVFYDLWQYFLAKSRGQVRKLSFHALLVTRVTLVLIIFGAVMFFIFEYHNSLQNQPWPAKILISLFQSITPRTAGFNTIDIATLTPVTLCIILLLMFIGGSPGSTAGGIKTSTAAVVGALFWSRLKNEPHVSIQQRRVDESILSKSISIFLFSTVTIGLFTLLLLTSELAGLSHQQTRGFFLDILFEAVSAFCTVGLSTGITPHLTQVGQVFIVMLMFLGRLGPLTVAVAVARGRPKKFQYAKEKFLVG